MNKKGYFFLIDAIVAVLIISIGVLISFSLYKYDPPKEQSFFLSTDVISVLSENRVYDLNPYRFPYVEFMINNSNITDTKVTVLEQIGELYYREKVLGCTSCNETRYNFTEIVSSSLIPKEYNYQLIIDGVQIYNQTNKPLNESTIIVPSKKMIHGVYNGTLWGPYVLKVVIWQ